MITGKSIPASAEAILKGILAACGLDSCEITSVGRTVEQQAAIMYSNCIGQGVAAQLKLYLPPGQQIIAVFEANRGKPRAECEALMAAKIREVGPGSVSHHICDSLHDVFDVAPSSIPASKKQFFENACYAAQAGGKLRKFLKPPADPAYHLEVQKS